MIRLGVNIDHVATLRNARGGSEPDPLTAAAMAELGGADQITVHLREDRRHIIDRDVRMLKETLNVDLNLEMAATEEMLEIAEEVQPDQVTLVPEKRHELTTEGGLNLKGHEKKINRVVTRLKDAGIFVSLFLDPDIEVVPVAEKIGADAIEFHTGPYANAQGHVARDRELSLLLRCSEITERVGVVVNAGHGLNYTNVIDVARIPQMNELNIGHSIVSRAMWHGLETAVKDMKEIIFKAITT